MHVIAIHIISIFESSNILHMNFALAASARNPANQSIGDQTGYLKALQSWQIKLDELMCSFP